MKVVLVKEVGGGFAFSSYEKVIKMEVRPARNGWFFEVRGGTKGGTLKDEPTITADDEAAAMAMIAARTEKELLNGYRMVA